MLKYTLPSLVEFDKVVNDYVFKMTFNNLYIRVFIGAAFVCDDTQKNSMFPRTWCGLWAI